LGAVKKEKIPTQGLRSLTSISEEQKQQLGEIYGKPTPPEGEFEIGDASE